MLQVQSIQTNGAARAKTDGAAGAWMRHADGLNEDQQRAFRLIIDRVKAGETITKTVGYAGTGKTFLMARVVKALQELRDRYGKPYQVTVAAPTHKAVAVLAEKMTEAGAACDFSTIHSLLGFQLQRDLQNDTGGHVAKVARQTEISGVVICDEASMIGTELRAEIDKKRGVQWIFVGDSAQLPPVGENVSTLLEVPDAELTTVVRQKGDSEILDLATAIRAGDRGALRSVRMGGDVRRLASADELFDAAYERFSSPAYDDDPAHARMLVFRNQVRQEINQKMRALIVGSPVEFTAGEWLVMYEQFRAPGETQSDGAFRCYSVSEVVARLKELEELAKKARYYKEKTGSSSLWKAFFEYKEEQEQALLHTSQEVRVEAVYQATTDLGEAWLPELPIWHLTIKAGDRTVRSMPVLRAEGLPLYEATLDQLRLEAITAAQKRDEHARGTDDWKDADQKRKAAWQRFYLVKELFAQVDYAYAMTTHKSQGSTFDHVFVDLPDLVKSPPEMRQRLLYTAVTRPSKTLTFYY